MVSSATAIHEPTLGQAARPAADMSWAHATNQPEALEACLLFLIEHHGRPMSLAALRAGVARPEHWQIENFVDAIESLGFSTQTVAAAEPVAPQANEPLLLPGADGDACVLVSRHADGTFEVFSPGAGRLQRLDRAALMARYAGTMVHVTPPLRMPGSEESAARGRHGHWFWGPILVGRTLFWRAGLAAVLTNIFALASSIFAMIVYDRVIPNNAIGSLYALLFGVGIVFISDFAIRMLRGYFLDVAGTRADMEIADALFDHVLDLEMSARRGATGTLASTIREFETIRDFFTSATLTTLIDLPFALLFVVVLYWIGGPMAWVPVVAIPLMIGAGLLMQPSMKRQSELSQEDTQAKQAVLIEALNGLESVKALGAGAVMRRRWQDAVAHQARVGMKSRVMAQLSMHWANMVFMVSQVAVVTVGVFLAASGQLGSGAIVAGSILCGRAIQPLAQMAQLLIRLNQVMASYRSLRAVMALPREHAAGRHRMAHEHIGGAIDLREVVFRYPAQTTPILDKVSLHIEAGERVAIVGRVGSGKTTLVKLLLGLYAPAEGTLTVGGSDVRQIDPADLRRNIGSVLQDVWLMSGTLRQNIALGGDRPSDADVIRVAELAGVHEFANLHPAGYQMRLGEQGEGLSGGQRQAVALARALIGDPPILVLDEPTSAMDPTAERLLLQRLKLATHGKTLVLVTHKPSMLELVDRIVVLERGRVVADGPKDAVLRAGGAAKEVAA
jgi:ATP-binding cassette, subfamily C, bacterial LapB